MKPVVPALIAAAIFVILGLVFKSIRDRRRRARDAKADTQVIYYSSQPAQQAPVFVVTGTVV